LHDWVGGDYAAIAICFMIPVIITWKDFKDGIGRGDDMTVIAVQIVQTSESLECNGSPAIRRLAKCSVKRMASAE
jgi:hypothetical protein